MVIPLNYGFTYQTINGIEHYIFITIHNSGFYIFGYNIIGYVGHWL